MNIDKPRTGITTLGATGVVILSGVIFTDLSPWWLMAGFFFIFSAIGHEAGKGK